MRLYHGSIEVVAKPEIRLPSRTLDYGYGFYTTTSYQQAADWVRRRMKEQKSDHDFINVYEFDKSSLNELSCLVLRIQQRNGWIS